MTLARDERQSVNLGGVLYSVDRNWAAWPADLERGFLSTLAVGADDRVYVLQRGATPVVVFEPDGRFAGAWGDDLIADGHGMWASADGRLFIVDRDAHQVIVTDLEGNPLLRLGNRHTPGHGTPFNHPTHASQAPNGDIFVSDGYGGQVVHRFSADGTFQKTFGGAGDGPGAFTTPHATWTLDDRVLVADRENNRVQIFDHDGAHLMDWTGVYHPMSIFVDGAGAAYVSDQIPRIVKYAPDGTQLGACRGTLNGAHGLFGNPAGDLFLAELPPAGITKLARQN